jgi:hypothetical protein
MGIRGHRRLLQLGAPEDTPEELFGVGRITPRHPARRAGPDPGADQYRLCRQGRHGTPDRPGHPAICRQMPFNTSIMLKTRPFSPRASFSAR